MNSLPTAGRFTIDRWASIINYRSDDLLQRMRAGGMRLIHQGTDILVDAAWFRSDIISKKQPRKVESMQRNALGHFSSEQINGTNSEPVPVWIVAGEAFGELSQARCEAHALSEGNGNVSVDILFGHMPPEMLKLLERAKGPRQRPKRRRAKLGTE